MMTINGIKFHTLHTFQAGIERQNWEFDSHKQVRRTAGIMCKAARVSARPCARGDATARGENNLGVDGVGFNGQGFVCGG